jgi:hypothetical protein
MAGSLVNLSLLLDDEVGLSNALQGVIANGLTLTSYTDGTGVPTLSNGRTGELAGALYRVEGGDMAVDVTGVSGDGTYYIYINPSLLTAYASATVPTWRGDLGGFYLASDSNVKAFFRFVKSGTSYIGRSNIIQTVAYIPNIIDSLTITGNLVAPYVLKRQIFTSSGTWIKPTSVSLVKVICVGKGGNGGRRGGTLVTGGGGGGAGEYRESIISVSENVTVTIGTDTSFGTFTALAGPNGDDGDAGTTGGAGGGGGYGAGGGGGGGNAKGGDGGSYGSNGKNGGSFGAGIGGAGGICIGSGGFSQFIGGIGAGTNGTAGGGGGAAGYGGNGGNGSTFTLNGQNGGGYGAGGGGAASGNGGIGGGGLCIVEWVE